MPLLDHFHPPLSTERRWESFHSSWATRLADALTEHWLPRGYIAEEHVHFGPSVEIDVATLSQGEDLSGNGAGVVATRGQKIWSPAAADAVLPAVFPATFEVRVLSTETGPRLVAAIELISPSNKDRPAERRAFAIKVASYLAQGISVILVDIVTSRRTNLHADVMRVMEAPEPLPTLAAAQLYAAAYRPLRRDGRDEIDLWGHSIELNQTLPTLPLGLRGDLVIPVDLEFSYAEACRRKRLTEL